MVEKVPSLKGGGAYWFTDLTTPDDLLILPVLTSLSFLATVEVLHYCRCNSSVLSIIFLRYYWFLFQLNMQDGMEGNPMAKSMKKFSRFFGVMFVPFTIGFPKVCNYELLRILSINFLFCWLHLQWALLGHKTLKLLYKKFSIRAQKYFNKGKLSFWVLPPKH